MKRMIIILSLAVIVLGLAIGELFLTNWLYGGVSRKIETLDTMVNRNIEHIDAPENIDYANSIYNYWVKRKYILKYCVNQNHVNEIDNRLIRIKTLVKINTYPDCQVEMNLLKEYLNDQRRILIPYAHNVF